jgi:hypothetical protein
MLPETGLLSCVPLTTLVHRISSMLPHLDTVIPIVVSIDLAMTVVPPL